MLCVQRTIDGTHIAIEKSIGAYVNYCFIVISKQLVTIAYTNLDCNKIMFTYMSVDLHKNKKYKR
jgi:hypothetical protein